MKTLKAVFNSLKILCFVFVLAACEEGSVSGGVTLGSGGGTGGTSGGTGGAAGSSTTDVLKIVTTGPSLTFNNMTGGTNAVAINPSTYHPAIAYYDKNSTAGGGSTTLGALKYAYVDTYGAWNIEVIDYNYSTTGAIACGTAFSYCVGAPNSATGSIADIIAITFKSTGLPVVAYVYGASLNTTGGHKQIRVAERDSSGNWTVSVAASYSSSAGGTGVANTLAVDPIKGIKIRVDSNDNIHIAYAWYSATIASSRQKHLFRSSTGTWTETDLATIVAGGTITAINQGVLQSGLYLCTSGGNQYLVATTAVTTGAAGINNQPILVTANVSSSGISSVVATNVMTGCGGACFSTALGANSGVRSGVVVGSDNKPIVGIFSTTNTFTYTATLPNDCATAQPAGATSWGALTSTGTANDGLNGFELASAGTDHLIGYSRSTTHFLMNKRAAAGAFVGPTLVETGVAWAAGEGIGMAYDTLNDVVYMSYAKLPGAAATLIGNDVVVASGSTMDINGTIATGQFIMDIVDQTSNVFPTTAIPMVSAAKAANGTIGYAYLYTDPTVADSKLYYGTRGGTSTNPTFSLVNVVNYNESAAGLLVGIYPSLAYDANNQPMIAYYNSLVTEANLRLARSSNNGASFSIHVIDDTSLTTGLYPSARTSGTSIGIAYYEVGPTVQTTALKFARYTPTKGWKRFYVDGTTGVTGSGCSAAADAGKYAKLRFTSAGKPVITYQRGGGLYIAMADEAVTSSTFTWTCRPIDSSGSIRGEGIDMELSSTDVPSIAHYDSTLNQVRVVTSSSIASGISSNAFTGESIGGTGSTITVAQSPQIELASDGTKWVSYYSGANQGMAIASKSSTATAWTTETIDANLTGGTAASLSGLYSQLLLNSSEKPMCFYRSKENWLKYFSREAQ